MMEKNAKVILISFLAILFFSSLAFGFTVKIDNTDYNFQYKRSVTIQGSQVPSSQDNFPMLFDSTVDSGLQADLRHTGSGGKVQSTDGYDIVFATGDGVEILKHEIEKYASSTGEYLAWVKVNLTGNDQTIYIYYGIYQTPFDTQHVTDVWDANYQGVWHLSETSGSTSIAVDAVSTGSALSPSSITVSHTTSGTDRLMVVGVSMNPDNLETVSSVTYGGAALTYLNYVQLEDDARVEIWYKVAPATGTANVVVTFSTTLDEGAVVGVITFTGVDQSTPLGTFASATGTAANVTVNVSSAPGELVLDVVCGEDLGSLTVDPSQTQRWNLNDGGVVGVDCFGSGSTEPGAATVTMSWTAGKTPEKWAIGAVPIKPAPPIEDSIEDSTSNANHGTVGGFPGLGVAGKMGNAVEFYREDEYINCGTSDLGLTNNDEMTFEVWFVRHTAGDWHDIVWAKGMYYRPFSLRSAGSSAMRTRINLTDGSADYDVSGFNEHDTNWHSYAIRIKPDAAGDDWHVYENGTKVGGGENPGSGNFYLHATDNTNMIGARPASPPDQVWDGIIDEVRISNIARSEDWIKTCYNNQNSPSSFYTIGSGQTFVELTSFTAKSLNYTVLLEWETKTELDNEGFNILRSEEEKGVYVQINPFLIHSKGEGGLGAEYSYTDNYVINGVTYYYLLEDIDFYGKKSTSGPIYATPNDIVLIWPEEGELVSADYCVFSWRSMSYSFFKVDLSLSYVFPGSETLSLPKDGWTYNQFIWFRPEDLERLFSMSQVSGIHLFWRVRARGGDGHIVCSDSSELVFENLPSPKAIQKRERHLKQGRMLKKK